MTRSADLVVIGGGIVGVSVAWSAANRGADVILLERSKIGRGCSFGNAGLIVPGFSLPLARPATIRDLPRMLLGGRKSSKVNLRWDAGLLRWMVEVLRASHSEKMSSTVKYLWRLGQASLEILTQLSGDMRAIGLKQRGWLHAYQTQEGLERGGEEAKILRQAGVAAEVLDAVEACSLEPQLSGSCIGGVYFPDEAEVEPFALVASVADLAQQRGAELVERTEVVDFVTNGNRVSKLRTEDGAISAEDYVVAAGAWSRKLLRKVLGWVPIEPAKGYSITTSTPHRSPRLPLMMGESHIVITPFSGQLRLTTGLDLVGFEPGVEDERIRDLQEAGSRWLRDRADKDSWREWFGFRPMTPDGLPLVGRSGKIENLWLASGHGQRGMTLASVTGRLIVDLITEQEPLVDPEPLSPDRFQLGRRD